MIEEPFAKGTTIVHMMDPRVKLVFALLFSIIIAITQKMTLAATSLVFGILLMLVARLNPVQLLKRLVIANVFIVLLWAILPFSIPGRAAFPFIGMTATHQGISYTLIVTMKCNAIILVNIGLISTSTIFDLVHALRHFRVPDKLIHIFFFLFRYANVMVVEYAILQRTLKVRGFRPTTSLHTYRTYGSIMGTLLVRGHDRSVQIHRAMVCRGFKGKYWLIDHFMFTYRDMIACCVLSVTIISFGLLQWIATVY